MSHIAKSLIAFKQVLTKILPAGFIQLYNYDLFEKVLLKASLLIQIRVQQNYIPESNSRYFLSYQKCQNIVAPVRCGLSPFPLKLYGKPYPRAKKILISPFRKIALNRFKSFAIKSLISSPIKQEISSNHPTQPSFLFAVISVVSYVKFQA